MRDSDSERYDSERQRWTERGRQTDGARRRTRESECARYSERNTQKRTAREGVRGIERDTVQERTAMHAEAPVGSSDLAH